MHDEEKRTEQNLYVGPRSGKSEAELALDIVLLKLTDTKHRTASATAELLVMLPLTCINVKKTGLYTS